MIYLTVLIFVATHILMAIFGFAAGFALALAGCGSVLREERAKMRGKPC